jgi:hypothetical protein
MSVLSGNGLFCVFKIQIPAVHRTNAVAGSLREHPYVSVNFDVDIFYGKGRILPHGGNLRQILLVALCSGRKLHSLRLRHILLRWINLARFSPKHIDLYLSNRLQILFSCFILIDNILTCLIAVNNLYCKRICFTFRCLLWHVDPGDPGFHDLQILQFVVILFGMYLGRDNSIWKVLKFEVDANIDECGIMKFFLLTGSDKKIG